MGFVALNERGIPLVAQFRQSGRVEGAGAAACTRTLSHVPQPVSPKALPGKRDGLDEVVSLCCDALRL